MAGESCTVSCGLEIEAAVRFFLRYLHSTRCELRRLGRTEEARDAHRRARSLVHDDAERRLLEQRLAELGTATGPVRR